MAPSFLTIGFALAHLTALEALTCHVAPPAATDPQAWSAADVRVAAAADPARIAAAVRATARWAEERLAVMPVSLSRRGRSSRTRAHGRGVPAEGRSRAWARLCASGPVARIGCFPTCWRGLGGLEPGERLVEVTRLVHRHDEERLVTRVAEAVRRLGRHHQDVLGAQLDHLVARVQRPSPASITNVSEYGCVCRSTPPPGGVRTMNIETPRPARLAPSKRKAVSLPLNRSSSKPNVTGPAGFSLISAPLLSVVNSYEYRSLRPRRASAITSSLADEERQHPGITFAVLALAGVSYSLLQSLVAPALPDIQHALHTSEDGVSWVLTSYLLSASVATPLIGRLGDMYGKERMLLLVLVLLSVGTLVSGLATSLPLMLAGRVVQGAAGGVFPLAFGIIRDEFPRERVAARIGLMSALLGVGGGAGVVLAGPIADNLSYHYLFWLPLIPIVIATAATHLFVPESPVKVPGRVSWTAAALMSVGLTLVLFAVSETANWHWLSAKTLGCIAGGIVVLALWVRSESRSAQPLVDMTMMRIRGVWTTNVVALL